MPLVTAPPLLPELLKEKAKRGTHKIDLLSGSFPEQVDFITDDSRRKVALCTRRAGKSYSAGLMLCKAGLEHPGTTLTYATMTLKTAKRIMFKDIVEPINRKFKLGLTFTGGSSPEVRFPNGSIIYLVGVDATEKEKDKLLGQKNILVVIDEAQDITIDLEDLIESVLRYTLVDLDGSLVMLGTPSDHTKSYFYDVTHDYKSKAGWSFHRWSALDNTSVDPGSKHRLRVCDMFQKDLDEQKKTNPAVETTPSYQQNALGRWVIDTKSLVYHQIKPINLDFDYDMNFDEGYLKVLGVDIGFRDADAFVIGAYSLTDKRLYILEAHKRTGNDVTDTANFIKGLCRRHSFFRVVIDGSDVKAIEEMKRRHGLSTLVSTPKQGKPTFISLFNADMDAGVIKILPLAAEVLFEEWKSLIWDPKRPQKEKEGLDNHASDACLYMWREARNYQSQEPERQVKTEEELADERFDRQKKSHFEELESLYDL